MKSGRSKTEVNVKRRAKYDKEKTEVNVKRRAKYDKEKKLWTPVSARLWTPEEDDHIRDTVSKTQGVVRWKQMGKQISRTGPQCSQRWKKVLDPNVKRFVKWTSDEDAKLIQIHSTHPDWSNKQVAELMPDRTPTQCHNRWWDKVNPLLRWETWSPTEDSAVWEGRKTGASWSKIIQQNSCLVNRAHVAVKNRWHSLNLAKKNKAKKAAKLAAATPG